MTFAFLALVFIAFGSCKKDSKIILSGLYEEKTPLPGRTQLNFIDNSRVVKTESGSNSKDTLLYSISGNQIELRGAWASQEPPVGLYFKKIDDQSFQIENLYPSIPELPKSYMTFRR